MSRDDAPFVGLWADTAEVDAEQLAQEIEEAYALRHAYVADSDFCCTGCLV